MPESGKITQEEAHGGDLNSLKVQLAPHMQALHGFLDAQVEEFEPDVRDLVDYCFSAGKRIRASLVFLGGWVDRDGVDDDLVRLAAVVELVHLATLVHDDIIDSADIRHNRSTATKRFGADVAVLLGDTIFAQAVHLSTQFRDSTVCRQVSLAMRKVCAGEVAQTLRNRQYDLSLGDYMRIIDLKTAELFAVSGRLGAWVVGYTDDFANAIGDFSRQLGVAYQIYDDLVDFFGRKDKAGKTLGTDFTSGKVTLPLLLLLEKMDDDERVAVRNGNGGPNELLRRIHQMLDHGIFSDAVIYIEREISRGEAALRPYSELPPTGRLLRIGRLLRNQVAALEEETIRRRRSV